MRWKNHKVVAFDTETTGLDPFDGDRVIEFGAVVFELDTAGQIVDRKDHSWLINPERKIPRAVTDITGIRNEDVEGAPPFAEIAPEIHSILVDAVAVAHNFPFDLAFLSQEFRRIESWWPEPVAEIDTVDLSRRVYPDAKGHKLSELCERVGVTLEQAHRATDDAAACGQCFIRLAQVHHIEDDLQVMLDWASAIGRPPEHGPLAVNERGTPIFSDGPFEGQPIAEHPLHLTWMRNARIKQDGVWGYRFDEKTRGWLQRWLQVRGSGRSLPKPRVLQATDWGLDKYLVTALEHTESSVQGETRLPDPVIA